MKVSKPVEEQTLIERLRNRAAIRRDIQTRKSVQEGKPDRLSDLLDEAADRIEALEQDVCHHPDEEDCILYGENNG